MDFEKIAYAETENTANYRNYLHRHPEVSGKEFATMKFIEGELDKLGIPWEEVPDAGIVGHIRGGAGAGRTLLLRADIDALPLTEDS